MFKRGPFLPFVLLIVVQCFCSDAADAIGEPDSTECIYTCSGNIDESCGGHSAITVYEFVGSPTPSPTPVSVYTPTSALALAEYEHIGCYGDAKTQRIMVLQTQSTTDMTTEVSSGNLTGTQ